MKALNKHHIQLYFPGFIISIKIFFIYTSFNNFVHHKTLKNTTKFNTDDKKIILFISYLSLVH